jgi:hypothetical protein
MYRSPLAADTGTARETEVRSATPISPVDHNDVVDRASIIVWIGIYLVLAVLILIIVDVLFFPLSGSSFVAIIVLEVASVVVAVWAIFFATPSILAISIFLFVAGIYIAITGVIAIVQFVLFLRFLRTDNDSALSTILIDAIRNAFIFVVELIFFGLAIALFVMAVHFKHSLERKNAIESEVVVVTDEENTSDFTTPEPSAPAFSGVRHRNLGVDLGVGK